MDSYVVYKAYMKTPVFFAPILILVMNLCGVTKSYAQNSSVAVNVTSNGLPATVDRTTMLQLVNEARKKGCQCGDTYYYPAPLLAWNTQLEQAAYNHSTDMARKKFFSHAAPDGSRGGNRIIRAGYNWKTYGENIGQGFKTEKEMVQGWLSSPGHCKNIMNKNFKEMGVARVGTLWTQEFGSR